MKICAVDKCINKVDAKGLCPKHYARFTRHGSVEVVRSYEVHGLNRTPEHMAWTNMKARCHNKNHPSYKNYGGRGIRVCPIWRNSFLAFYNDIGPRPSAELTLDRINNDGDYEPGNVRWAARNLQQHNRRTRNRYGYKGVQLDKRTGKWSVMIKLAGAVTYLGAFTDIEQAARAYDEAALSLYGTNAVLNFPLYRR